VSERRAKAAWYFGLLGKIRSEILTGRHHRVSTPAFNAYAISWRVCAGFDWLHGTYSNMFYQGSAEEMRLLAEKALPSGVMTLDQFVQLPKEDELDG